MSIELNKIQSGISAEELEAVRKEIARVARQSVKASTVDRESQEKLGGYLSGLYTKRPKRQEDDHECLTLDDALGCSQCREKSGLDDLKQRIELSDWRGDYLEAAGISERPFGPLCVNCNLPQSQHYVGGSCRHGGRFYATEKQDKPVSVEVQVFRVYVTYGDEFNVIGKDIKQALEFAESVTAGTVNKIEFVCNAYQEAK